MSMSVAGPLSPVTCELGSPLTGLTVVFLKKFLNHIFSVEGHIILLKEATTSMEKHSTVVFGIMFG